MGAAARPRVATTEDLLALPDDGQGYEILDGELFEKETSGEHARAQANLVTRLNVRFGRRPGGRWPGGWWFATEPLIAFPEVKQPLRPDVVGWRREKSQDFPTGKVLTVVPDWICEILSLSNSSNDTIRKKRIYHHSHVGHYWLLDPIQETLQALRWHEAGFIEVLSAERDELIRAEPFEAVALRVAAFFGDDEDDP